MEAELKAEAQVLKKLKKQYKEALDGINDNIAALLSRTDTENLQGIVYQVQYQEALKTQISGIIDQLESKQFTTVSEYLTECYENGFLGAMYDIHDQGIPMIFPINQKQVVNALTVDSKLSKPLYQKLGESTTKLKHNLQRNLSRGIAQGESYYQIAQSMTKEMVGDYSRFRGGAFYIAERIVRTEGHRIANQGKLDIMQKAIDAGADVVKQWDATLDKRTRPAHARADGQIREMDEDFDVWNEKLPAPGIGGSARNVINCRCVMLQRAKWALDEDELQTLKDRAAYYGIDKTKDFDDFKKKYMKLSEMPEAITPTPKGRKKKEVQTFGSEQEVRDHLSQVKSEYADVEEVIAKKEKDIEFYTEVQKDFDRISSYDDPHGLIEKNIKDAAEEIANDSVIKDFYESRKKRMEFLRENWIDLENGYYVKEIRNLEDAVKENKKELRKIQKRLDAGYDELEKFIGTPNVQRLSIYGDKHLKPIKHYLDDAPKEYRDVWETCSPDFHVLDSKDRWGRRRKGAFYSPSEDGVYLSINSAAKGSDYQTKYQVVFHEYGHHSDYVLNRKYGDGNPMKAFTETYRDGAFGKKLKEEANKAIEDFARKNGYISLPNKGKVMQEADQMVRRGLIRPDEKTDWIKKRLQTPTVDRFAAEKAFAEHIKKKHSLVARSDISDMFEPVYESTGYPFGVGHGKSYWYSRDNGKEGFAEMYSAAINNPESWEVIKEYFPESVKIFEEMIKVARK